MTEAPFPPKVEIQVAGTWTDVSTRARNVSPIQVTRGSSDESSQSQPATCDMVLKNEDGNLTPGHAMSPWWPDIDVGLPVRVSMPDCIPHLVSNGATGNEMTTPDHVSLDVIASIWLAGEVSLEDWHDFAGTTPENMIIEKWGTAGNRSYRLVVNGGGIFIDWSTDGTAISSMSSNFAPVASDGRMAVGCWLQADNGAGGHTGRFYVAPRISGEWTLIGTTVNGGGTTSIFSSSSIVRVGRLNGHVWAAEIRSGTITGPNTGNIAANPNLTLQTPGATSFVDTALTAKTWTVTGAAKIDDHDVRFHGAADSIELAWPKAIPRDSSDVAVAHVNVSSSVAMRRMLQGRKPLDSTLRRKVTSPLNADVVVDYWPFEDGENSTTLVNAIPGGRPLRVSGDFSLASDDRLAASKPVMNVGQGQVAYTSGPIRAIPQVVGVRWEVTRFFRIDEPPTSANSTRLMTINSNGQVATWRIEFDTTAILVVGLDADGGGVVLDDIPYDARFSDTWAMIILEVVDDGANVDWAVSIIPIPLGTVFAVSGTYAGNTGIPTYFRNSLNAPPAGGVSVGHLIVTSGADIGWLAGADTAWINETAAHRFARLCREEHLPYAVIGDATARAAGRGDTTLSQLMGPQRPLAILDLLEECVTADQGRLFERRDALGLVFRTSQALYNQDPGVTFDVDLHGLIPPFTPVKDTQRRRNFITVTRPDGSSAEATTDPAPAPVDLYDSATEVNVVDDQQLPDQAGWRLHLGTWPAMRYPGYNAALRQAGEMVRHDWCQLDIGDMTRATSLMDQHDETVDTLLEGYTEVFDGWNWTVGINASPAGPWAVGVRDDDELGKRDDDRASLAVALTASLTDVNVALDLDDVWTREAGEFPFDLNIGGERITATGFVIFGAYIFDDTIRAVNGVLKAHPIGTPVSLWRPTIRAL